VMCRNEAIFDNPNRVCRLVIERKMRFCFDCVWVVGFWATSINLSASSFVEFGALKTGADGLHYTEGVDEPFTGRSVEYYPDGTKRNLYTWENGRKNGLHIIWYEATGRKKIQVKYTDDLEDGISIEWHPDGRLKAYGVYQLGKKQGLFLTWHESGQWATANYYDEDQQVGLSSEAGPDGTVLKELLYEEGKFIRPPSD